MQACESVQVVGIQSQVRKHSLHSSRWSSQLILRIAWFGSQPRAVDKTTSPVSSLRFRRFPILDCGRLKSLT